MVGSPAFLLGLEGLSWIQIGEGSSCELSISIGSESVPLMSDGSGILLCVLVTAAPLK